MSLPSYCVLNNIRRLNASPKAPNVGIVKVIHRSSKGCAA